MGWRRTIPGTIFRTGRVAYKRAVRELSTDAKHIRPTALLYAFEILKRQGVIAGGSIEKLQKVSVLLVEAIRVEAERGKCLKKKGYISSWPDRSKNTRIKCLRHPEKLPWYNRWRREMSARRKRWLRSQPKESLQRPSKRRNLLSNS